MRHQSLQRRRANVNFQKKQNINNGLEETVKQSQSKARSKQNPEYPIGLKNIGNTCFLNSIIQFLYGAQDMRNSLIEKYGRQQNMSNARFSKLLGKLFSYMKQKSKDSTKIEQILNSMANRVQELNTQYQRHLQEDALQTLLNILLEIEQKHPDISECFNIEYKAECSCSKFTTKERLLSYGQNMCSACNKVLRKTLINEPKYIIYSNPSNEKIYIQRTQQLNANNQSNVRWRLSYKLKAQIIYMGNGRQGHYIAHRVDEGKQFYFSDSMVYPINRKEPQKGLILLYQFVKKDYIQAQIDKQVNKQAMTKNNQNIRVRRLQSSNLRSKQRQKQIQKQRDDKKQNYKIQKGSIYQFKISLVNHSQEVSSVFFNINTRNARQKGQKRNQCFRYYLQINNKQAFPYYQNDPNFNSFYESNIEKSKNQLQKLGDYLRRYLNYCQSKNNKKQQSKQSKLYQPILVYNAQTDTIQKEDK